MASSPPKSKEALVEKKVKSGWGWPPCMLSQSVAAADGPRAGLKFCDTHRLAQARQRLAAGIAYLHKRRSPRLACTRGRTPSVTPGPDKKLIGRICHNIKADWSCLHGKKVNRLVGQGCSVFTWQFRCQRLRPSGWNQPEPQASRVQFVEARLDISSVLGQVLRAFRSSQLRFAATELLSQKPARCLSRLDRSPKLAACTLRTQCTLQHSAARSSHLHP